MCPSYFLLIKAWTEIGCGLGWLVALRVGAVLGRSAEEGQEPASYAVALEGGDECWSIDAQDLLSTGEFCAREDYYDRTSIRVSVRGELVD